MPTIAENMKYWDGEYSWEHRGDEWSRSWGDVSIQWYGTILPRIHRFLPAGTVLEIGCGYGRWSYFLKDRCAHLVLIDLSRKCIEACRERFQGCPQILLHCNDGTSLDMVDDESVDFVFSFDALPLVDPPTIEAYIAQLPRVLKDGGSAFLHHSNLGAYPRLFAILNRAPALRWLLEATRIVDRDFHWRDVGVSADSVRNMAARYGLSCESQELFRWGTRRVYLDAFSVIRKGGASSPRRYRSLKNAFFDREAENLRRLSRLYSDAEDGGDVLLRSRHAGFESELNC